MLLTPVGERAKMVVKRETKKARLIASASLEVYLMMDYISTTALDQIFSGAELSTLFMSSQQLVEFWARTARFEDGAIRMPLDQSAFDQNQTKRMIQVTLEYMRTVYIDHTVPKAGSESITVWDNIIRAVGEGSIYVNNRVTPYLNGVLSGWRWTALLDTIINAATLEAAAYVEDVELQYYNSQGDDLQTRWSDYLSACRVWSTIQRWGFIVNPNKFFISPNRDEYLRKVVTPLVVDGYPARAVNALVYRNPVNMAPPPGRSRLAEMLSQWLLLVNRLGLSLSELQYIWEGDLSSANRMEPEDVVYWVHTPKSYGGGGIQPYIPKDKWRETSTEVITYTYSSVAVTEQWAYMLAQEPGVRRSSVQQWAGGTLSTKEPVSTGVRATLDPVLGINFKEVVPIYPPVTNRPRTFDLGTKKWIYDIQPDLIRGDYPTPTKWSNSVWEDYVLGRLTVVTPTVEGYAPAVLSYTVQQHYQGWRDMVLPGVRRVNKKTVQKLNYTVEISAEEWNQRGLLLVDGVEIRD